FPSDRGIYKFVKNFAALFFNHQNDACIMKKFGCYGSLMIFFLVIFCSKTHSQGPPRSQSVKITITGTVVDSTGKKIEGASIVSLNRRNVGTSTDANGR